MVLYFETSAILAWLLGESAASAVHAAVDEAQTVLASVIGLVETHRALVHAETGGQIAAADRQRLRGLLARAHRGWVLMEVSSEVRERAGERFPIEPVRTLDGLHLATALLFARVYPDLEVLSLDRRVADNARALGFRVRDAGAAG